MTANPILTKYRKMKFILIVLFSLLLVACEAQKTTIEAPPHPNGVPKEAMWIGGTDGGVFVVMHKAIEANTYLSEVFFDQSGDVWYKGRLLLQSQSEKKQTSIIKTPQHTRHGTETRFI